MVAEMIVLLLKCRVPFKEAPSLDAVLILDASILATADPRSECQGMRPESDMHQDIKATDSGVCNAHHIFL